MRKHTRGFTLVELIIVIVVLAILAAISIVAYNGSQARARDTVRRNDVSAIAEAIALYRQRCGNDVTAVSSAPNCATAGCGSNGNGNGWFNYDYGSGNGPILGCLQSAGYLNPGSKQFVDPSGCVTSSGSTAQGSPVGKCSAISGKYYSYMKYTTGAAPNQVTCVFARLENPTSDDTANATSIAAQCGGSIAITNYNMNYGALAN